MGHTTQYTYPLTQDSPGTVFISTFSLHAFKQDHTRQVYNILDLMGDLGGVLEVLVFIFGLFLFPISEHSFTMKAISILYLARTENKNVFQKAKSSKKKTRNLKTQVPSIFKGTPVEKEVRNHHAIKVSTV